MRKQDRELAPSGGVRIKTSERPLEIQKFLLENVKNFHEKNGVLCVTFLNV